MHEYSRYQKGLQPVQGPSYGSSVKEDNVACKHVPEKDRAEPVHYYGADGRDPPGQFRMGKFVMNTNATPRSIALVQRMVEALQHIIAADPPESASASVKDPLTVKHVK